MLLSGPVNFAAEMNYPVGQGASAVVAADFNGDGKADLAVANSSSNTVSILLNKGDGRFGRQTEYATGSGPAAIAAADFNGDGKIDLAVTGKYDANVSVLLNRGDGTFAPKTDYACNAAPASIVAADFNHDGKIDLAVANNASFGGTSTASVLLNNGDGTFGAPAAYNTGPNCFSVVAADFNGDGNIDLAAISNLIIPEYTYTGEITVLRNNGDGTFRFAGIVGYTGNAAVSLAAADFNGDGRIDLAEGTVGNQGTTLRTFVFLNQGNGAFLATAPDQFGIAGPMTAADFNGDNKIDLAVCRWYGDIVAVGLNKGNGRFLPPARLSIPYQADPRNPNSIAAGDFNGDGRMGLAITSGNQVSVLLNVPNRPPTRVSISSTATLTGQAVGTAVGTLSTDDPDANVAFTYQLVKGRGSSDNALFRIDGNVLKNAAPLDIGNYYIRVRSTDAGGLYREKTFVIRVIPAIFGPPVQYTLSTGILSGYTADLAAGDFNGDGKPDLAVGFPDSNKVGVLLNKGDGTFAPDVDYATGHWPGAIAAGDFNGDGMLDVAVANYNDNTVSVLLNAGNGTFLPHVDYAAGTGPKSLVAADFNGDGRTDLAVADYGRIVEVINNNIITDVIVESGLAVLFNNGDGTFAPKVDYATPTSAQALTASDLNGDGRIDLAWCGRFIQSLTAPTGLVGVLLNKGGGAFAQEIEYPISNGPDKLVAADLNGDGHPDLVWGTDDPRPHYVGTLLNNGKGTFSPMMTYNLGDTDLNLLPGDFNGDGKIDIDLGDYLGHMLLGNGDGTFSIMDGISGPAGVVADFNGDGKLDLAGGFGGHFPLLYVSLNQIVPHSLSADVFAARRWIALANNTPTAVNFGILRARRKGTTRIFRVANAGSQPLALGKIIVPKGFKLLQDLPRTLPAGQSAIFKLQFVGTARGQYTGSLGFTTSDPLRNPFIVPLYARRLPRA